jgi:anti-sigma regulatory factor (Ser/Thr protein kinase)
MSHLPAVISVDDSTRVAEARRKVIDFAEAEGLDEAGTGEVAIIASEMATNLLKHAHRGELHISRMSDAVAAGVEILSIDRGPGVTNFQTCLADGFSTSATSGTGLGAISRMSDIFDAWSQPGKGTVLVARKFASADAARHGRAWDFGAVKVPYPGEQCCGDNWAVRRAEGMTSLIVADGLGHGIQAADASSAAVTAFRKAQTGSSAQVLEDVHLALRSTRGAAVAIAHLMTGSTASYAGLGNIAGVLLGPERTQSMVSHNGTAGMDKGRFQEFNYSLSGIRTVVMHSDGLVTNWSVRAYPGLLLRHPSLLAGVLYRDASRGRDDVCIVVGRCQAQ